MRKALIAAIVATALFAVGAFAADFAVDAEDVASGEADVQPCASSVAVNWTTDTASDGVGTDGEFMSTGAELTFTEVGTDACEDQNATIAVGLDTDAGNDDISDEYVSYDCGAISGGTASCSFTSAPLMVSQIEDVSVLAEGFRIP